MLKNYLTIAVRNLRRRAGYTLINAFGLAVGLACCLLIGLFVYDEFSYDRFHADADRLVLVTRASTWAGEQHHGPTTSFPLARAMEEALPGIEAAATTNYGFANTPVRRPATAREADYRVTFADSTFLDLFTFLLVRGDAATALDEPHTVVLSQPMAVAFFGDADPLGQTLEIEVPATGLVAHTVTGVFAPLPHNSYFQFEALASLSSFRETTLAMVWGPNMYRTFARLAPGASAAALHDGLAGIVAAHLDDDLRVRYDLLPLTELYLSDMAPQEGFRGSKHYLLLFASIALFVLLLAVINYMNLATAQATQRVREVGVRKTLGAGRGQIARQFLVESFLVASLAAALGLAIASLALPVFNGVFEKELTLAVGWHPLVVAAGVAVVAAVGLVVGSYPALYLSSFRPARLLRHEAGGRGGGAWLRKGLVVIQFSVTAVLLVATGTVYQQMQYVQTRDLGFAGDQVLTVPFTDHAMAQGHAAVKQAVLALPGVLSASATSMTPGQYWNGVVFAPDPEAPDREANVRMVQADADHLQTLGLTLVAGRDFDPDRPTDDRGALILNERAAEMLGEHASLGQSIHGVRPEDNEVIGIVEDYHFASLREPIAPLLLRLRSPRASVPDYEHLLIRFRPDQAREVVAGIEGVWTQFGARRPPDVSFLDDAFAAMYTTDRRLGQLFGVFAAVAIVIACLGLFGLAAYAAERRTKEIGIRKVLGAGVANLIALLSKEFLVLVAVSLALAWPLAYVLVQRWLANFAYRVEIGPSLFLLVGSATLGLALFTVAFHTLRAATANPVESLRAE